jgi:N utilization substance protein A
MEGIKLGPEEMKLITLFESVTSCRARDCLIEDDGGVTFVVNQEELGKCLGRNIRRLSRLTGKSIHVIGYSDDLHQFVRNLFSPAEISRILLSGDGKTITLEVKAGFRGMVFGKGKKKLARAKKLMARYYGIKEVVVRTSGSL